jgi:hypothetical protein
MPFMLKIQWDIKAGREADFRANQAALCKVMFEHPGIIPQSVSASGLRSMQPTRRSQRTSLTQKARAHSEHSLKRATRSSVNAGGTQTPGPKRSSRALGRRITRRPQVLLSLIPGPIGTRGFSEIPMPSPQDERRNGRLIGLNGRD